MEEKPGEWRRSQGDGVKARGMEERLLIEFY
jgi:hypothetical protein